MFLTYNASVPDSSVHITPACNAHSADCRPTWLGSAYSSNLYVSYRVRANGDLGLGPDLDRQVGALLKRHGLEVVDRTC